MKLAPLSLIFVLLASACTSELVEEADSVNYDPVYPVEGLAQPAATGGIYTASSAGLFASDRRAARVGDILTVEFEERFQASKTQSTSGNRASDYETQLPAIIPLGIADGALDNSTKQSFSGRGSAQQSNSLSGRLSVSVVRVLPGGLLEIAGQKRLTLNQGNEYIRLTGVVRPEDINAENVVMSDRIAHATIKYVGAGAISDTSRQGWLRRGLNEVSPL